MTTHDTDKLTLAQAAALARRAGDEAQRLRAEARDAEVANELTLESLREWMQLRARDCERAIRDDLFRAPEHPAKLRPEAPGILTSRRNLYDEIIAIIDDGRLPDND